VVLGLSQYGGGEDAIASKNGNDEFSGKGACVSGRGPSDGDEGLIPFERDPIPASPRSASGPVPAPSGAKPMQPKKPAKSSIPDPKRDVCPGCG
jgi:hypothetical protein